MRRFGVLVLACTLAACGSSGGGSAPGTSTTSAPPRTTTTTLSPAAQALRPIVDAGLLQLGDLPAGASDSGQVAVSHTEAIMRGIDSCRPFAALADHGVTDGTSNTFTVGKVQTFDTVEVFGTPADADARRSLYQDPAIIDCLAKRYEEPFAKGHQVLPKNVKLAGTDVSPLAVDPYGDGEFGFRITINFTITKSGATSNEAITTDLIGVQIGQAIVTLQSTGGTAADDAAIETMALPQIVGRVRTAEG